MRQNDDRQRACGQHRSLTNLDQASSELLNQNHNATGYAVEFRKGALWEVLLIRP